MAKYRRKPVVVEAVQYTEHGQQVEGICDGRCNLITPHIHTLEGTMMVSLGDWIVIGIEGEVYPCKPSIFAKTYEPFNE